MYELWRATSCPYRPQFTQVEGSWTSRCSPVPFKSEFMMWDHGGSQWGTATPKIGGAFVFYSLEHKGSALPCQREQTPVHTLFQGTRLS